MTIIILNNKRKFTLTEKNKILINEIISILENYYKNQKNIELISELKKNNINISKKTDFYQAIKKIMQYLINFKFVVLTAQSTNSLRHNFPIKLLEHEKSRDFFKKLEFIFKILKIEIKTVEGKEPSYIYFGNYESFFKVLIFWDENFIKFPSVYINPIRKFFNNFDIYINFKKEFVDKIFSEKGLIAKKNLPITKFFKNIINFANIEREEEYGRHAIYKWRDDKFFPIKVFYDLLNSEYGSEFRDEYYNSIVSIKIGKSSGEKVIEKALLDDLKKDENKIIERIFTISESYIGWLLFHPYEIGLDINEFISDLDLLIKDSKNEKYVKFIESLKTILIPTRVDFYIKSLKIRNFKSFSYDFIKFNRGINIFYGLNASGKTTLLEAILFALYQPEFTQDHTIIIRDFYNLDYRYYNTYQIKDGEDFCEVELVVYNGEKNIVINRKLYCNGEHQLIINNEDVFQLIKDNVLKRFSDSIIEKWFTGEYGFKKEREVLISNGKFNNMFYELLKEEPMMIIHQFDYEYAQFQDVKKENEIKDGIRMELFIHVIGDYFFIIYDELRKKFTELKCFFNKNEIFSTLYLEFEFLFSIPELDKTRMSTFFRQERYLDFYKDKIKVLKYVDKLIRIIRDKADFTYLFDIKSYFDEYYSEFEEKDEKFFTNVYYLLLNKYLNVVNSKLVILSKQLFDNKFFIFLGKNGIPSIEYVQSGRSYPINSLSGGEKSKLFLLLYGIINNLSNVITFLLIDEPNELLDLNNVDLMKQLFFKLFKRKQLIICTFVEKYKSFQPALIYKIWKDRNHVSHAFQIERDKEIFELYKQLDEIEKKIEQKPYDHYIIQKKFVLLIKLNRYQEALDFYHSIKDLSIGMFDTNKLESYLKNIIKHEKEKEKSKEIEAKYYRNRALIFYELKELHHAIENADEALKLEKIPEFYDFKAHSLIYTNKPNSALKTLEDGIKLFPDYTDFHNTKGDILENLGRYEEALSEINKAIEIKKNNPWNYYKKAFILGQKLERFEEALISINKALEFHPEDGIYNADKINYLINIQKFDEAYETLERYKENIPEPNQVLFWIYEEQALNYAKSGKKDEAIDLIKKAIALFPDWPEYYHTYGKILMDFGDYESALMKFEKAKELHITPIETYIKMGKCLIELGKYDDALENLKIGKKLATHSVKSVILTEDDKRVTVDNPQKELIEEAEKYINEAELGSKIKR